MTKDRAPGLKTRTKADGTVQAYWVAAQCTRRGKDYPLKTVPLSDLPPEQWADRCQKLYNELLIWLYGDHKKTLQDEDTMNSLIDHYTGHELSPYHLVKYNTKVSYDDAIKWIRKAVGTRVRAHLKGEDFIRWHKNFTLDKDGGYTRIDYAHRNMSMVRRLLKWGIVLELKHCKRLSDIISELEFEQPKQRDEYMTYSQAKDFINQANINGKPSMALAQALQFELALRQKDVIGEWIPDMTGSGIRHTAVNTVKPKRWDNGLTWSHVDNDMILRKDTVKTGQGAGFDLKMYPMLMAELMRVPVDKRVGPMIISENTGMPYTANTYRTQWRIIADLAGLPKEIQNRDSRSGSITEATDANAGLEIVRHHSTHKNASMTARYSKNTIQKTSEVARLRVAARNEK